MKHKYLSTLLCMAAMTTADSLSAQVLVNYEKYPDYSSLLKPDPTLGIERSAVSRAKAAQTRPVRVNNAETPYFPPVFNQDGGSCGSASRIGYMFNYEINAFRGADGSLEENQYPTHFTWLLTNSNSGKEGMAAANGIPNVPVYGGRTYSRLFGNQDTSDPDFGWMQGYDKWYAAMCNRISRNANFPMSVQTEEGREAVKNWIWNHNGDTDFKAGGICGIGVASGGNWQRIPQTEANDEAGVTNQYYVQNWGKSVDHALTIVGYDDRIEFDLDGNGIAGEKDKDEVGAWIVVNSWGNQWCNKGFIYCPYKNAVSWDGSDAYYYPEVYHVRKNYRPFRTFKIKMEYSKRSEICISGGISADVNASTPERLVQFEHFKYAGDGDGNGVDAEVPMLGRWADGMHYEPMEFGYDMTDLSASFDTRKPLKYFLIIDSKASASGSGKVHACSLIDYEFEKNGIEFPFDIKADGVKVETKGNRTIISVVVPGEPLNAPRNLMLRNGQLSWNAPAASPYELKGYKVYCNGSEVATLEAGALSYQTESNGNYEIAAQYLLNDEEALSTRVGQPVTDFAGVVPETNKVRSFSASGFEIVDLLKEKLDQATMEFWIKPTTVSNWNQQMGPGWGNFLLHTTSAGELVVGWDTGNRITSKAGCLQPGKWAHVAVVIDKSSMTAYVNGEQVGSLFSSYSGIGGFGSLKVGAESSNGLNAQMDEFRMWNYARTQTQIQGYMYTELKNPQETGGLLTEIRMDDAEGLTDATGHYTIRTFGTQEQREDNTLFNDKRLPLASFTVSDGPYYVGSAVQIEDTSKGGIVSWKWDVTGAEEKTLETENPVLLFTEAGQQTIALTITDAMGRVRTTQKSITVQEMPAPEARFKLSAESIPAGTAVSLINESEGGDGCKYTWSMPGAQTETAHTRNASAAYLEAGDYEVTLTVTNAAGSSTLTQTVHVEEVAPQIDFNINPQIVIKGEQVNLEDRSLHHPTFWKWEIENDAHCILVHDQNQAIEMKYPGIYKARLTAYNEQGGNVQEKERAVIVCNADGQTGLNFGGGNEYVQLQKDPIAADAKNFTIDWWMYAKSNSARAHRIGNDEKGVLIETAADGTLSVTINNQKVSSPSGTVTTGQWHHYAVVFKMGSVYIYKDAQLLTATSVTGYKYEGSEAPFCLSGKDAPMNAVIDEFRVWNSALTDEKILEYANNVIADVPAAMQNDGLSVYYQFNQNSGDVQDATTNANTGTRVNFGPSGDSWSASKGIFCLATLKRIDCTDQYLTNYLMPFRSTSKTVNPMNSSRFVELEQGTAQSAWKLENSVSGLRVTTGFHVDKNKASAMTLTTSWDGFAEVIKDHKAYQTVTLPAGYYVLGVEGYQEFAASGSYLVAANGKGLPTTENVSRNSIAYAPLADQEVGFVVSDQDQEVSLGILANMSGKSCLTLKRVYLEKKVFEEYGTPTTDIESSETATAEPRLQIVVHNGSLDITSDVMQRVRVVSVSGLTCFDRDVQGTVRLSLAKGIYIVNGKKVMVF